jgi:hypothetical protein
MILLVFIKKYPLLKGNQQGVSDRIALSFFLIQRKKCIFCDFFWA